jgi:hypothetical protein
LRESSVDTGKSDARSEPAAAKSGCSWTGMKNDLVSIPSFLSAAIRASRDSPNPSSTTTAYIQ